VISAFLSVMILASMNDVMPLAASSALPAGLLFIDWRGRADFLWRAMRNVNVVGVLVWIFMPLTYPGERLFGILSESGLHAALIVTWKLNLMSAVLLQMVVSMGVSGIADALGRLGIPLKLRMLILLTARYVFLLAERVESMWRAVRLRAPGISGLFACRSFACVVGTTLIHSADTAGRSALAMSCRGGMSGFFQQRQSRWGLRDSLLLALFLLYFSCALAVSILGRCAI
jgi:cobalt/nickel transport system permease protein